MTPFMRWLVVLQSHLRDGVGETSEMDLGRTVSHATAGNLSQQPVSVTHEYAGDIAAMPLFAGEIVREMAEEAETLLRRRM